MKKLYRRNLYINHFKQENNYMQYKDFVSAELERIGAAGVLAYLKKCNGKKVLIYSHDDPDGLTSAGILTSLLSRLGASYDLELPATYELDPAQLKNDIKKDAYDAVFLLDKGTMGYYNSYSKIIPNMFVIDHHPLMGDRPAD